MLYIHYYIGNKESNVILHNYLYYKQIQLVKHRMQTSISQLQ